MISIDYAETNHYKKQILIAHVAGALHSGFVCKTGCVLAEKGGRGGAAGGGKVSLPPNDAQIKHIFDNRKGHVADTESNRRKLVDLANDGSKYMGNDKYGNSWHVEINEDGQQWWVRFQNNRINEGGLNHVPKPWDPETGLNFNPFK